MTSVKTYNAASLKWERNMLNRDVEEHSSGIIGGSARVTSDGDMWTVDFVPDDHDRIPSGYGSIDWGDYESLEEAKNKVMSKHMHFAKKFFTEVR